MRSISYVLTALLLVVAVGCGGTATTPASTEASDGQLFAVDGDFAGSHILISYKGAAQAGPDITRTKEEARQKAEDLIARLQTNPDQFEELARQESDGPTGPRGGNLGAWRKGQMVPEFDAAIESLEIGQVSPEPVETAFGYHIIRRNPLEMPHYGADAFIIGFAGSPQTPPDVTRSHEAADSLAQELADELTGEDFEAMAREYNDFADSTIFLGGFAEGQRVPLPGLVDTLKALAMNEVAGPFELPVGYMFVRRVPLEQRAAAHILIAYEGAMRAAPSVTRTQVEAAQQAAQLAQELQAHPDSFAVYAQEYSDDPSGAQGGDLGHWFRGQMVPAFDEAIDELEPGEITETPVETDFGYHIIQRRAVE